MEQQKNRPIRTGVKITCPVCGKTDVSVRWGQHKGKPKAGPGPGPMKTTRHSDPRYRAMRCVGPDDAMEAMLEASGLWVAFENAGPTSGHQSWKSDKQQQVYEQAQDEGRLF